MFGLEYQAEYPELLKRVAFWFLGLFICYVVLSVTFSMVTQSS
jgi:hypothetical protein